MIARIMMIFLITACSVDSLYSQDWFPTKIVGVEYPAVAIAARIQGAVKVKCVLDPEGDLADDGLDYREGTGTPTARD